MIHRGNNLYVFCQSAAMKSLRFVQLRLFEVKIFWVLDVSWGKRNCQILNI